MFKKMPKIPKMGLIWPKIWDLGENDQNGHKSILWNLRHFVGQKNDYKSITDPNGRK